MSRLLSILILITSLAFTTKAQSDSASKFDIGLNLLSLFHMRQLSFDYSINENESMGLSAAIGYGTSFNYSVTGFYRYYFNFNEQPRNGLFIESFLTAAETRLLNGEKDAKGFFLGLGAGSKTNINALFYLEFRAGVGYKINDDLKSQKIPRLGLGLGIRL